MVTDGMIGNLESSTGLILKMNDFRLMDSPVFDTEKPATTKSILFLPSFAFDKSVKLLA